jgi:histidinol-phosphatase (PHP family)
MNKNKESKGNKVKANFHMHTIFCDGKDHPEAYVMAAIARGFEAIGFSAHSPISLRENGRPLFNNGNMRASILDLYFAEIARLKEKYADRIEIYAGLEIDYLATDNQQRIKEYVARADYTIGSVHFIYDEQSGKYYSIDGSAEHVAQTFAEVGRGDNRECARAYYNDLVKVIRECRPNIVGHLDVIKKQNKNNLYFDEREDWYRRLIDGVLFEVVQAGTIVEVNTGGMLRGYIKEVYPSPMILKECLRREIPIVLSSDAHQAQDINGYFAETVELLRDIGFTKQKTLRNGRWIDEVF